MLWSLTLPTNCFNQTITAWCPWSTTSPTQKRVFVTSMVTFKSLTFMICIINLALLGTFNFGDIFKMKQKKTIQKHFDFDFDLTLTPSEGRARWLRETMNSCWHAATERGGTRHTGGHKLKKQGIVNPWLISEPTSKKFLISSQASIISQGCSPTVGAIPWPFKESPQKMAQVCNNSMSIQTSI